VLELDVVLVDPFLRVRGGEVPHQGGNVATEKTGDAYTVNDASVVCGNLQTRNATVYLIDTVLMPTT
jgi:uncharacterized surface protein with fasciclin (FAS1) repeats